MKTRITFQIVFISLAFFGFAGISQAAVLFEEGFEDSNFYSRGWYDSTGLQLTTTEHIPGSVRSVEYRFLQGGTTPTGSGGGIRKLFAESDEVYVSYWVKYSSNYVGSGRSYHPHEFLILTNENSAWHGPSNSHMTAYIEHNEGVPVLAIQDSQNIDESRINIDLSNATESRAIAGCNGAQSNVGADYVDCYLNGSAHRNGLVWKANGDYFRDIPGPYYKNNWHHIEAYFKMNSVSAGRGVTDGIVRYWYDGQILIDHDNVIFRTAQYPNMRFNQFLIAPYIGDGSPIDQSMWVDDLTVSNSQPVVIDSTAPATPSGVAVN